MMLKGFLFSYTVEKVNSGQNSLNGNLGSEKTRILAYFAQCICDLELPKQWRTSGIFLKMISKKKNMGKYLLSSDANFVKWILRLA